MRGNDLHEVRGGCATPNGTVELMAYQQHLKRMKVCPGDSAPCAANATTSSATPIRHRRSTPSILDLPCDASRDQPSRRDLNNAWTVKSFGWTYHVIGPAHRFVRDMLGPEP